MDLSPGAQGYRVSNPPIFVAIPLKASLEIFSKTSMEALRQKSLILTGYLETLIKSKYQQPEGQKVENDNDNVYIDIFTPSDPKQRGAQLSLAFNVGILEIFKELEKRGVVCDKRMPRVIRISPCPIYCSFLDVHRFMGYLHDALMAAKSSLSHIDTKAV